MSSILKITIAIILTLSVVEVFGQCAMCSRVAESSAQENKDSTDGLNKGIIYLLSVPYIMGGIGVFVWYKNRKKS